MPSWPDVVNGGLEMTGAAMLAMNVVAVRRDKTIKGIHWSPTVFFTVWGLWNVFYYPTLGQWFSFVGGLCMVASNAAWLLHVWWYWRKKPDYARTHRACDALEEAFPGSTSTHAPVPQEGA